MTSNPTKRLQKYPQKISTQPLWIGLKAPLRLLDKRINQRVNSRAGTKMTQEAILLKRLWLNSSLPAASAIGYRQWQKFLDQTIPKYLAVKDWQLAERQYARKQLTWFKAQPKINWFDISQENSSNRVEQKIKTWYAT